MAKDNTQPDDHTNNTEHTDHTNNTDHTETAEASGAVPYEDGTEHGSVGDETTTEEAPASGTRPGGVFSAETFGLTALLLLAMTLLSGQLLEIFTNVLFIDGNPVPVEQVDQFSTQIVVGGVLAAISVLTSVLALVLSDAGTHPWARWVSTATFIVGLLLVIIAVLSYIMLPEGVEQQMPSFPQ